MTIRRVPSDFIVRERLSERFRAALRDEPAPDAPHAVYELSKTSLTTPEAVTMLSRAVGVPPGVIACAGLKDKHASTVQHATVPVRNSAEAATIRQVAAGKGWSASLIGWSPEGLTSEHSDGNAFEIIVRDLSPQAAREMDGRAEGLRDGDGLIVVNYFGDQRFGSARHGQGWAGERLIRGDFLGALRLLIATPARKDTGVTRAFSRLAASAWGEWERLAGELPRCPERRAIEALASGKQPREAFSALPYFIQTMCVEAYQSMLWNEAARRIATALGEEASGPPREEHGRTRPPRPALYRTPDAFGEMVFPHARAVAEGWRAVEMILPAHGSTPRPPWGEHMLGALAAHGVCMSDLRIPGLRRPFFGEAARPLFIRAERFGMDAPERDELARAGKRLRRALRFELRRGSYATVVLRALGQ